MTRPGARGRRRWYAPQGMPGVDAMRTVSLVSLAVLIGTVAVGCRQPLSKQDPDARARGLVLELQGSDPEKSGKASLELIRMGEPAVPALVALLREEDPRLRGLALSTLWAFGPKARAAVPDVVAVLSDPDADLRLAAVRTLGTIGPEAEEAVPALIEALNDKERPVRQAAVKALGAIGPRAAAAIPVLTKTLRRGGSWPEAEEAILKIRGHGAEPLASTDPSPPAAPPE